jgi:serine/threonine-protein kinase
VASLPISTQATATEVSSATRLIGRAATTARAVWIVVALLAVITFLVGIPSSYQKALTILPETRASLEAGGLSLAFPAIFLVTVDTLTMLGFTTVAVLLFWRRSDDWMALFVGMMLLLTGLIYTDPAYNQIMPLWVVAFLIALGETCQVMFCYLFPNGRPVPRVARWLVLPLAIWRPFMWGVLYLPNLFANVPIGAETYGRVPQDDLDIGLMIVLLVLGIASQVYRYRKLSTPVQRQQVKWLLVGMVVTISVVGIYIFVVNVLGVLGASGESGFFAFAAARLMRQIALLALPLALGISVLRYRLWDIDLIINRGLVYGALTLLYIVTVIVFQQIAAALTGGQQSSLAVAASTALIAALFQPIRRVLQRAVDRRFYPLRLDLAELSKPTLAVIRNPGAYAGKQVGTYEVTELIGRGGMGEIYKGRHPGLERTVAIKILPESRANNAEFRARFEREARLVASLRHPNIVNVFDFGTMEDMYYMVMEFIEGQELREFIRERGRLPLPDAYPFVRDVAAALDYAHEQGLVHRDVKPANVMLQKVTAKPDTGPYNAILMDFGIAKIMGGDSGLTKTGTMGTLDYIAPEQILASREVDHRADIYALGVVTFEMLTGELPFKGDNAGQILMGHLQMQPPNPRDLVPELSPAVTAAILRALAKKPEARFQKAGQFATELASSVSLA